jgi:hypothetical protein
MVLVARCFVDFYFIPQVLQIEKGYTVIYFLSKVSLVYPISSANSPREKQKKYLGQMSHDVGNTL